MVLAFETHFESHYLFYNLMLFSDNAYVEAYSLGLILLPYYIPLYGQITRCLPPSIISAPSILEIIPHGPEAEVNRGGWEGLLAPMVIYTLPQLPGVLCRLWW